MIRFIRVMALGAYWFLREVVGRLWWDDRGRPTMFRFVLIGALGLTIPVGVVYLVSLIGNNVLTGAVMLLILGAALGGFIYRMEHP